MSRMPAAQFFLSPFIQDSPKCLLRVAASERQSSRLRSSDVCSLWFAVEVNLIIVILLVFIFLVLFTVSQAQIRCRCRNQWRPEVAQALSTFASATADCVSEGGNSGRSDCSTVDSHAKGTTITVCRRLRGLDVFSTMMMCIQGTKHTHAPSTAVRLITFCAAPPRPAKCPWEDGRRR